MKYEIVGTTMPMVVMNLDRGEVIQAQPGAMKWKDVDVEMKTSMSGGLGKAFSRAFSGESMFMANFVSHIEGGRIAFGHSFPGHIIPVDVTAMSVVCQKRAFLCSTEGVDLDIVFQKKLGSAMFSGEGLIMQKLSGRGMAFVELDGEPYNLQLAPGEKIHVETGAVTMFDSTVQMNVEMVKGMTNMLFGGESLFLTTLTGPGKVYLSTMSIQSMAGELRPYFPSGKK